MLASDRILNYVHVAVSAAFALWIISHDSLSDTWVSILSYAAVTSIFYGIGFNAIIRGLFRDGNFLLLLFAYLFRVLAILLIYLLAKNEIVSQQFALAPLVVVGVLTPFLSFKEKQKYLYLYLSYTILCNYLVLEFSLEDEWLDWRSMPFFLEAIIGFFFVMRHKGNRSNNRASIKNLKNIWPFAEKAVHGYVNKLSGSIELILFSMGMLTGVDAKQLLVFNYAKGLLTKLHHPSVMRAVSNLEVKKKASIVVFDDIFWITSCVVFIELLVFFDFVERLPLWVIAILVMRVLSHKITFILELFGIFQGVVRRIIIVALASVAIKYLGVYSTFPEYFIVLSDLFFLVYVGFMLNNWNKRYAPST